MKINRHTLNIIKYHREIPFYKNFVFYTETSISIQKYPTISISQKAVVEIGRDLSGSFGRQWTSGNPVDIQNVAVFCSNGVNFQIVAILPYRLFLVSEGNMLIRKYHAQLVLVAG
jgi:hypothetical protein